MSILAIQKYHNELQKIKDFGGSRKETAIRNAFYNLLNEYATQKGLLLIAELSMKSPLGNNISPDGTLKDSLRLNWGYWESKDEYDDIDEEIRKKFAKGYPKDNILFEDSATAVLIQNGTEVARTDMRDAAALDRTIKSFVNYERPEVIGFRKAIELFRNDVPTVAKALRELIENSAVSNPEFIAKSEEFLETCKQAINPYIVQNDVNEMMIQHILTADIFNTIFDEPYFHRENNIAQQLETLINTFFTRQIRNELLNSVNQYYAAINAAAAGIADHHEKQKFLKVVYETFYKAYNPKAADRLGVVYTPNEIVRFMIESADYLLHKHFGRFLADKNVEILDPATGTGTFVCDLIDYLPKDKLEYKYKNEIHANEVAILPYYIANLNIEFTYKQRMGKYAEFESLCFVDTLDNMGFGYKDKQEDIFGFSAENTERIKRQNERKISVIIGNPPYNAKQENYNMQNANRIYTAIDKRIKDTYILNGTAQNQIVMYDMYVRFLRWATDRIDKNGIVAFISNNSFVNAATFDGFRKIVAKEFSHIYIIDLKGNARTSGEQRRKEKGNVFDDKIRVGVAIYFMIRRKADIDDKLDCQIYYNCVKDYATSEEKREYLAFNKFTDLSFEHVIPDRNNNWINLSDNDFDSLMPLMDKDVKAGHSNQAIFKLFSSGVKSQRDEWVYDLDKKCLEDKVKYMIDVYQKTLDDPNYPEKMSIKWDRELEGYLGRRIEKVFDENTIKNSIYRPFYKMEYYFDKHFNGMTYLIPRFFPNIVDSEINNQILCISGLGSSKPFQILGVKDIPCLDLLEKTQCLPLYRYDEGGNRIENITDWALEQFRERYPAAEGAREIGKEDIFRYVYAVLHCPDYRKKYESNLKREFPRIPFYDDFWKWSERGGRLLKLHIDFESAEPYELAIRESEKPCEAPRPKLKANKETGEIVLDENTTLTGVPALAWEYKLGNRSALEWILDQYKEKKPKDPTIAEKFNTYRFADYKEKVIDLLRRVTTVSVETMKIIINY